MTDLPQAFLAEMRARLGDGFAAFLASYDQPHVTSLRLNPFREHAEALAAPFIDGPVPWEPFGRYTRPGTRPGLSLAHFGGAYYMQEASAMLAAAALDVRPGMKVLDLCAAPGGKSGQILRMLAGRGLLISNEPDAARARMLAGNLERLGAVNAVVTNEYPDRLAPVFPAFFDAILVDAPCSGEGMFRRDPGAIAEWNPSLPEFCHRRQLTILESAATMLRPGGQLVFSTCTFNGTENEGTVAAFLAAHPEFTPEDFRLPGIGASEGGMLRAWPHLLRGEGHFVSLLRKSPDAPAPDEKTPSARAPRRSKAGKASAAPAIALPDGVLAPGVRFERLVAAGDALWSLPEGLDPQRLGGLRTLRTGLLLARAEGRHIEPDHALAMALHPEQAARTAELTRDQALAYQAGEALDLGELPGGCTLLTHQGVSLGFGRQSGGLMKNRYPKGLRRR